MTEQDDFALFYGPTMAEVEALKGMRVLIVGLGAVGSHVARLLAYAGLSLILIDVDELTLANLHRHILSRLYVGWNKARAVADHLARELPPEQEFIAVSADILNASGDALSRLVSSADVVVAATGSNGADRLLNRLCREHGVALLVPQVFPHGTLYPRIGLCTGRIHLIPFSSERPRDWRMGCVECIQPPRGGADAGQTLDSQPGLVTEVGIVAQYAAHLALALLQPETAEGRLLEHQLRSGRNFFLIPSLAPRLASLPTARRPGCDGCLAPVARATRATHATDLQGHIEGIVDELPPWVRRWAAPVFITALGLEAILENLFHMQVSIVVPAMILGGLWIAHRRARRT